MSRLHRKRARRAARQERVADKWTAPQPVHYADTLDGEAADLCEPIVDIAGATATSPGLPPALPDPPDEDDPPDLPPGLPSPPVDPEAPQTDPADDNAEQRAAAIGELTRLAGLPDEQADMLVAARDAGGQPVSISAAIQHLAQSQASAERAATIVNLVRLTGLPDDHQVDLAGELLAAREAGGPLGISAVIHRLAAIVTERQATAAMLARLGS